MKNLNSFSNNEMLAGGMEYIIGLNDGRDFHDVIFKGTTMYNGKPMMRFALQDGRGLTINPSYHSFTLEAKQTFPMPSDFNKTKQEGDNNGKINSITSRRA